ncbi:MAG: transposase [Gammaproteobacteria bacterium]
MASADDTQCEDTISVLSHRRKSGGRKPLPERLPRLDVIHELPADERRCDHDGQPLNEIGEVISEQLDIVPATIQVIRHVRKRYACACGRCIKTAPLPVQPIPKSMASSGLLAHVTVSKYQDGLPLYRTEIAPALLYLPPSMAVAGDDITAHRRGHPTRGIGELDDRGGYVSATVD